MPEATFLCIDSSEHMRNGDIFPSRLMATQEACNLIVSTKMSSNPENTIGFLTMGGKACTVRETLTADVDRVMASMTAIPVGGQLHFIHGLQIANLALSHRKNSIAVKRVIAVVGSPITEEPKVLEKLAKKMRKDSVAVDIISVAVEENLEILEKFVSTVNKDNNSRFLHVPANTNMSSTVFASLSGAPAGSEGPGGGAGGFEFGVDPNVDPELAMVLRMSLEEERRRVEAAAAVAAGGGTQPAAEDPDAPKEKPVPDEEDELEAALRLSLEEANRAAEAGGPSSSTQGGGNAPATGDGGAAAFQAAMDDPEFLAQLAKDVGVDPGSSGAKKDDPDNVKDEKDKDPK